MSDAAIAARVRGLIDLTNLEATCTPEAIDQLCRRALQQQPPVPAVCVWPAFVAQAARLLRGSGVRVATVVNFPSGDESEATTLAFTRAALHDGADEIDLVLPYRAFLAGDVAAAEAMVRAVRAVVVAPARLKVILESGEYPDLGAVRAATQLAIGAGADFVKTSTGKTTHSASLDAVRVMLEAIVASGKPVGIKPSGGIRSLADAVAYLQLADDVMGPQWATAATFRFGASGLLDAVDAALGNANDAGASSPEDSTY
ncbi:MAG: deoxyribose-phosphate aldolase [Actinomycetota bacterium]